jgi:Arylsulfatase A and related enzymes
MLIVNTDHGYLLGEHGWWSKSIMPVYNEIANTPLFIYDPRSATQGVVRESLAQTIDIPATLLDFFSIPLPKDMQGRSLRPVIEGDAPVRDYALFGHHGSYVNVCDGRYVYMRAPGSLANRPIYEYTLMPTHMRELFQPRELQDTEMARPFSFTKGCKVMKIASVGERDRSASFGTKLYDIKSDPRQERPLDDLEVEARMARLLARAMRENDCPEEQFARLGLPRSGEITESDLIAARAAIASEKSPAILVDRRWTEAAASMYRALRVLMPRAGGESVDELFSREVGKADGEIDEGRILAFVGAHAPKAEMDRILYAVKTEGRLS